MLNNTVILVFWNEIGTYLEAKAVVVAEGSLAIVDTGVAEDSLAIVATGVAEDSLDIVATGVAEGSLAIVDTSISM